MAISPGPWQPTGIIQTGSRSGSRRASGANPMPGGKSGLHRAGCRLTTGRREATESATEIKPPTWPLRRRQARVKRRGKSSPRAWQHGRHGKPHPEQGQIGKHGRGSRCFRVGCLSVLVTARLEEWLPTTEPGLSIDFPPRKSRPRRAPPPLPRWQCFLFAPTLPPQRICVARLRGCSRQLAPKFNRSL